MYLFLALISVFGYALQEVFLVPYSRKMDGLELACYRNLSLGISMLPLLFFVPLADFAAVWQIWPFILAAAFFGAIALPFSFLANKSLPVGIAGSINKIRIILIVFWSYLWLQETIQLPEFFGMGLIILGVIVLTVQKSHMPHLDGKVMRGVAASLASGFFASIAFFLVSLSARMANPLAVAYFWEICIGIFATLFLVLRIGIRKENFQFISWKKWSKIGLISSATLIGTGAFTFAVNYGSVGVVGVLSGTTVIVTTLFSHFLFHEKLSWLQWISIVVVVCGVAVLQL